jgi:hypothetical protein
MKELKDPIKGQNLRIMSIEGEETQVKGIHNMFNKTITENFPNLEKVLPTWLLEASRTPNKLSKIRTSPQHIIIKTSTENR